MRSAPMKLYALALSPFVQKVAAILDFKKIPYEPVFIHPFKKTEIAFSRRKLVPILGDGDEIVEDSTEIALYLETTVPDPQLIPDDRVARGRVLATERWFDDKFVSKFFAPLLFGVPANRERAFRSVLDTAALSGMERRLLPHVAGVQLRHTIAQAQSDLFRVPQALDDFETRLGSGPFLAEQPQASVADISAFGVLSVITDLNMEGAERLRERTAIHAWMERVRPLTSPGTRIYRG